jgi:hypothetical protein
MKNSVRINCALCDCEITNETDSKEHIIPQAIGGRLKVKGFICKDCNNKKGGSWDAELASQLNFFNLFFGVTRENGNAPSQQVNNILGDDLLLRSDGTYTIFKPVYEKSYHDSIQQVSIKAANKKQLKQIVDRAKKDFPNADFDTPFNQAKVTEDYSNKVLKTSFEFIEDKESGKSVIKSCLALAAYYDIKPQIFSVGLEYLKNDYKPCFGYFYERDLVLNRPSDTIFHCIAITGNNELGKLFGYIEYFGIHRIVAILSDSYDGQNFTHVYAIDLVSSKNLEIEVNLLLSEKDIEDIYNNTQLYNRSIYKAFEQIMPIIQAKNNKKRADNLFDIALKYAWDNCGAKEGELLTEEHLKKMSALCAEKFFQLWNK